MAPARAADGGVDDELDHQVGVHAGVGKGNPDGEALTEGLIADARVEPQHLIHFDDRDAQFVRSASDGDDHAAASLPGKSTPWQLGGQDADVGLDDAGTAKHPGVGEQRRADPGGRVSLIALIALRQSIGGPDAADPTTLWGASPPTTDQKG